MEILISAFSSGVSACRALMALRTSGVISMSLAVICTAASESNSCSLIGRPSRTAANSRSQVSVTGNVLGKTSSAPVFARWISSVMRQASTASSECTGTGARLWWLDVQAERRCACRTPTASVSSRCAGSSLALCQSKRTLSKSPAAVSLCVEARPSWTLRTASSSAGGCDVCCRTVKWHGVIPMIPRWSPPSTSTGSTCTPAARHVTGQRSDW
mmetsp:Transcript_8626/g.28419  ORF Transcript_8626/g.28419 Transcript_8626/m.28419 type:complete len:214 (+) Transcript_8626:624-1265(+)